LRVIEADDLKIVPPFAHQSGAQSSSGSYDDHAFHAGPLARKSQAR
jgi:hypothetical protein